LRAYALIRFAEQRGIALTEAELAASLWHHSGKKAGQPISMTAAGAIVDELEAVGWVAVQRRAGAQGRHRYVTHDIAPAPVSAAPGVVQRRETAVEKAVSEAGSSQVGEGSGSPVDEGSLASKESPTTDSPEDGRPLSSPAVGETPVGKGAAVVENPATQGSFALRAGEISKPCPKPEDEKRSNRDRRAARSSYTGPQLSMTAKIYAVLEPVHVLLERVTSDFVARKIAREVG
jgi:hypothetical protein